MATTADAAVAAALASALRPLTVLASGTDVCVTLYDPRFGASRPLAVEMAGGGAIETIHGDPTALALNLTQPMSGSRRRRLQGVTTESVPFCLGQLLPGSHLTQRRIDRDLFVWTLERGE